MNLPNPAPPRNGADARFERWGYFVGRHPWAIIVIGLLISILPLSQISGIRVDNSIQSLFQMDDPALVTYNEFRTQFGFDQRLVLGFQPPDIFDPEFLDRLRRVHEEIEEKVPHVERVISLVNARRTYSKDDSLIIEPLMRQWPETEQDLAALRQRVFSNPLYTNNLISEDGEITLLSIELSLYSRSDTLENGEPAFITDEEIVQNLAALREIVARYKTAEAPILLAGPPAVIARVNEAVDADMRVSTIVSVLVLMTLLYFIFRSLAASVLPLLVIAFSTVFTIGLMASVGIPLSAVTGILPCFLIVVGICDSVHLITIAFRNLRNGMGLEDAVPRALGHTGMAIFMTSLTTACGLGSFMAAELVPTADFGFIAPWGVMLAFLYSVTLLPASLLVWLRRWEIPQGRPLTASIGERMLLSLGDFAHERPWTTVMGAGALLLIAGLGISRVVASQQELDWFPEDDPLVQATRGLDRHIRAIGAFNVVIRAPQPFTFHEPAALRRVERAAREGSRLKSEAISVGQTLSAVDMLKETHAALSADGRRALPGSRKLVAQEFLLFENGAREDLERFMDSQYSQAHLMLRTPYSESAMYPPFKALVQETMEAEMGKGYQVDVTGLTILAGETVDRVIKGATRAYAIAFLAITPLMLLLVGHWGRGALSMIPNLLPVFLTLGLMGWLGIRFDLFTSLIGSIIFGLAVDDTIHFMYGFRSYYEELGDTRQAIRNTLQTTGSAMFVTSLILAAGFAAYTLAYLQAVVSFGLLAMFAVVAAFLADVLVAPALMTLATRKQPQADLSRASRLRAEG